MWFLSFDALIYMLKWMPLEGKIWVLQLFFGYRLGTLIFWVLYQASMERGSFRMLTHDSTYDNSYWTSAINYVSQIASTGWLSCPSAGYVGRVVSGALSNVYKLTQSTPPKKQIALSAWELIN